MQTMTTATGGTAAAGIELLLADGEGLPPSPVGGGGFLFGHLAAGNSNLVYSKMLEKE